ncbi:MAG: carboxylating nicotinate-nucleotide diphosphorylase [Planctomycetota bacterium]|nr:carboxylating nicotinate-nucleotide diphosphorylase [Planctomycetota bacterium]
MMMRTAYGGCRIGIIDKQARKGVDVAMSDFHQIEWDDLLADDCRQIVRLAVREDLDRWQDWTTVALVAHDARGTAAVVVREDGVLAGLPAAELVLDEMNVAVQFVPQAVDGQSVRAGQTVALIEGATRDMLTCERIVLNMLGRLSGIATTAHRFVEAVGGHAVGIYDTRKTTPGWRRLEKYAAHCGGARNHRTGLFDAILIKDNHLAAGAGPLAAASAVRRAKEYLAAHVPSDIARDMIVEVEVDSLEQLSDVLPEAPDIVLLDNMSLGELRRAVEIRNASAGDVQLEASGGVSLDTVAEIAATGVDRISVGALTRSAVALDIGLDWIRRPQTPA